MEIHYGEWDRAGGDSYACFWAKSRKQTLLKNTDDEMVGLYSDAVVDVEEIKKLVTKIKNDRGTHKCQRILDSLIPTKTEKGK